MIGRLPLHAELRRHLGHRGEPPLPPQLPQLHPLRVPVPVPVHQRQHPRAHHVAVAGRRALALAALQRREERGLAAEQLERVDRLAVLGGDGEDGAGGVEGVERAPAAAAVDDAAAAGEGEVGALAGVDAAALGDVVVVWRDIDIATSLYSSQLTAKRI